MTTPKEQKAWEHFSKLFPKRAEQITNARKCDANWFETEEGLENYRLFEAYRMGYMDGCFDTGEDKS